MSTRPSIYKQFRNPDAAPSAMAEAMRIGYHDVFVRNEYAYNLTDEKFKNLLVEMTGKDKASSTIQKIVASWKACKNLADFDAKIAPDPVTIEARPQIEISQDGFGSDKRASSKVPPLMPQNVGVSFDYNININLPTTTDPKVYNAIFSALQDTLLKE